MVEVFGGMLLTIVAIILASLIIGLGIYLFFRLEQYIEERD